ncbi:Siroheme synthase [Candidatus Rhodobacter oscarellae]|uniref:Siroheme synthase n=1 Tax=Candidatus Rhodobacter oscarellae TaxID=1675527 RepID=A0A0J9ECF2_9RHOB|nr:siroheme synthase CysG [Candidatus Rhodobacter lobularis]KMW59389.1 Siroheme synthase [Candidatus Rhodobacter lobularis]
MKSFPMFLKTTGRRIVIVGGGEQAAQKTRLMQKTDGEIVLVAPELDAELRGFVEAGLASHHAGPIAPDLFDGTALTFIATGCPGADRAVYAIARSANTVINVVDTPELCDALTPSLVDRDPVVVAIGTEGTAPVLGRSIKTKIEAMLPPRIGHFAALAGHLRGAVARSIPMHRRRAFWAWAFGAKPAQLHDSGDETGAARMLKAAIASGRAPDTNDDGHIALVGAGPGARDLLTLRAVERLQEADVIYYDRLVDPDVLELARRDAERVFVGKEVGACAWPQDKITALIVAEAKKGRHVVRLKSGDPSVFGRATEELEAARAAGISVEIVPGITAASAAAARMGIGLTERGTTDAVVLVTGKCKPGDPAPEWARYLHPGSTLAIYMGVGAASQISQQLISHGVSAKTPVDLCIEVSKEAERIIHTDLGALPELVSAEQVTGGAVIFVRVPKSHSQGKLQVA